MPNSSLQDVPDNATMTVGMCKLTHSGTKWVMRLLISAVGGLALVAGSAFALAYRQDGKTLELRAEVRAECQSTQRSLNSIHADLRELRADIKTLMRNQYHHPHDAGTE